MDFVTTHAPPVIVNIDGIRYEVRRFLMPQFNAWAADRAKAAFDAAVAYFPEPEQKARFRLYWSDPAFDVAALADELRTPAGVVRVLETCLGAAGVPKDMINKLIDNADPLALRAIAGQLASVDKAVDQLQRQSGDGGKGDGPLIEPQRTSGAAESIGASPTPGSAESSAPAMKIA